jgi:hypothetical protein
MSGPTRPTRCGMEKCTSGLPPRPFPEGWRCPRCTPSARAGVPEPDELLAIAKERRAEPASAYGAEVAG